MKILFIIVKAYVVAWNRKKTITELGNWFVGKACDTF